MGFFSALKRSKAVPIDIRRSSGKDLILFVHGLSGSTAGTWQSMLKVLSSAPNLSDYSFDCYAYPTQLLRWAFGPRMPGIQEISQGLRTFIATQHADKSRIFLVGHSLGGLVARQLVLDEIKDATTSRISGIVLYATPNNGAALANIGKLGSWGHRHLHQISKESDLLSLLNQDWIRLRVEERLRVLYVVGGSDAVVEPTSACLQLGASNVATIIEHGHRTIIEPSDSADTRFKVLQDFVLWQAPGLRVINEPKIETASQGDVLFDVYSLHVEQYYLRRKVDEVLASTAKNSHIWLSGSSGVGKTAAIRRLADQAGWKIFHVMLDGYVGAGVQKLMIAICNELHERAGLQPITEGARLELPDLLANFRKVLRLLALHGPIAIVIEEIPLPPGEEYSKLLSAVAHLANASETVGACARVIWLFSSINDPRKSLPADSVKFQERVQLVACDLWEKSEILSLIELIDRELKVGLSAEDRQLLAVCARGNPRFIKMVFRRRRTQVVSATSLAQIIKFVEADFPSNG
ncbi:MAG TPA: alpha/beta fold hydrolase [Steroidobacteraceae bacterium]|nr:alpha/beta fold hydrolase [Steroidobacteraceae bacterium]